MLNVKYRAEYQKVVDYEETQNTDLLDRYGFSAPFGSFAYNAVRFRDPALPIDKFQGIPSKKMSRDLGNLLSKRNEVYLKIITGEFEVDAFDDEWRGFWETNGGKDIEAEVNDWYAKNR